MRNKAPPVWASQKPRKTQLNRFSIAKWWVVNANCSCSANCEFALGVPQCFYLNASKEKRQKSMYSLTFKMVCCVCGQEIPYLSRTRLKELQFLNKSPEMAFTNQCQSAGGILRVSVWRWSWPEGVLTRALPHLDFYCRVVDLFGARPATFLLSVQEESAAPPPREQTASWESPFTQREHSVGQSDVTLSHSSFLLDVTLLLACQFFNAYQLPAARAFDCASSVLNIISWLVLCALSNFALEIMPSRSGWSTENLKVCWRSWLSGLRERL